MVPNPSKKILFVCLGNICRSPLAQGVFQHRLMQQGGDFSRVALDSAGTVAYHIGKSPDPRACSAARASGFDIANQRARQVSISDFDYFDEIFAMDRANRAALLKLADPISQNKIRLVMSLLDPSAPFFDRDVPDPYYGDSDGFTEVVSMLDQAAAAWIASLSPSVGN